MICLYLYEYWFLYDVWYIIRDSLSTFQHRFDCENPFIVIPEIIANKTCIYWWSDISVICCHFCTSYICAHSGLFSTTWFVRISPLIIEIQVEWSLTACYNIRCWLIQYENNTKYSKYKTYIYYKDNTRVTSIEHEGVVEIMTNLNN